MANNMRKMFTEQQISELAERKANEIIKSGKWLKPIRVIDVSALEEDTDFTMEIGERILFNNILTSEHVAGAISPVDSSVIIISPDSATIPNIVLTMSSMTEGLPAYILMDKTTYNQVLVICDLFGNLIVGVFYDV